MTMTTTPPTSWYIEVYLESGERVQNVTVNDPTRDMVVLTNLVTGTVYMVRVAGINTRAIGNFSELQTAKTFEGMFQLFIFI